MTGMANKVKIILWYVQDTFCQLVIAALLWLQKWRSAA